MARRNYNKLTRRNVLAHIEVNAAVDDIRILYGARGVDMAEKLVANGLATHNTRNGFATYNVTAAGRAALDA